MDKDLTRALFSPGPIALADMTEVLIGDDLASLADTMCSPTPPTSLTQTSALKGVAQRDASLPGLSRNHLSKDAPDEVAWLEEQEAVMRM